MLYRARSPLLYLLCLVLLSGCAAKAPMPPEEYRSSTPPCDGNALPERGDLLLATGRPVSLSAFPRIANDADYILIGETHDNALHHRVQASLLRVLAHSAKHTEKRPILALEMIPATMQRTLDGFNSGRRGADGLAEDVEWASTWGFPFALYRPVLATAEQLNIPVYGLNIDRNTLALVRSSGLNAAREKTPHTLPKHLILPHEEQRAMLQSVFESHISRMGGTAKIMASSARMVPKAATPTLPAGPSAMKDGMGGPKTTGRGAASTTTVKRPTREEALSRFLLIQALWDSTMAENAVALHKKTGRPVVILAGSAHVDKYGIGWRIAQLDPNARIIRILPTAERIIGGGTPKAAADLYFYAPPPARLGLRLAPAQPVDSMTQGLVVMDVTSGSRAEQAGIVKGDVIIFMAGKAIRSMADLHAASARQAEKPSQVTLVREGKTLTLDIPATVENGS